MLNDQEVEQVNAQVEAQRPLIERVAALTAERDRLAKDLRLNAEMLAKQTDLARQAETERDRLARELAEMRGLAGRLADNAEMLMTVVCNVSGGDWKQQSQEWRGAARRYVDEYYGVIRDYLAVRAAGMAKEGA